MERAWPGSFSSLEVAQPIPQTVHAPSRFVHAELDPFPVSASTHAAALMGAVVDVLPGNGHFPWLEDPGCVRRSLGMLLRTGS